MVASWPQLPTAAPSCECTTLRRDLASRSCAVVPTVLRFTLWSSALEGSGSQCLRTRAQCTFFQSSDLHQWFLPQIRLLRTQSRVCRGSPVCCPLTLRLSGALLSSGCLTIAAPPLSVQTHTRWWSSVQTVRISRRALTLYAEERWSVKSLPNSMMSPRRGLAVSAASSPAGACRMRLLLMRMPSAVCLLLALRSVTQPLGR
mmetsp:Transcript_1606/g.2887  ORF Transcript_1606/g.2887 Transcript_1606/m.2887 type:complete len:202 (+) Transcript_1606:698-1303(+)